MNGRSINCYNEGWGIRHRQSKCARYAFLSSIILKCTLRIDVLSKVIKLPGVASF